MSQFSTPPHDQAQGLRSLAQPTPGGASAELANVQSAATAIHQTALGGTAKSISTEGSSVEQLRSQDRIANAPYVVLISETHSLQGVLPLALHLAQHVSEPTKRLLLVDLAPAASRLADAVAANGERFRDWVDQVQPLWTPSLHGRTLHAWKSMRGSVDLLAQLATEFPSAEQMPRIVEQLVRQLGQQRVPLIDGEITPYHTVFLLSEFVGVPLDNAAWQAADEIWLFHDVGQKPEQVRAGLMARLSPRSRGQRVVLFTKQPPTLRNWGTRRRIDRIDAATDVYSKHWNGMERFQIAWPQVPGRLARSMSGTARELALQLLRDLQPRSTRQAS